MSNQIFLIFSLYYPEIIINILDFQYFTDLENQNKVKYINYILRGINSLEKADAEFVILAANSPHSVFDEKINVVF